MKYLGYFYNLDEAIVSTLVVEWIEIANEYRKLIELEVSTLVVEWIEMAFVDDAQQQVQRLHPRGGVD